MYFKNKFQLQLTSSNYTNLNYLISILLFFLTQNNILNLKLNQGIIPTKTKKFTVLKSPHIYKTARTQLEIRTLKKVITITNFNKVKQIQIFLTVLQKIIKNLPTSTTLQIKH